MTVCEHDFMPGEPPKNLEVWELTVQEAVCTKCGFVHPDLQFMPPEVLARRQTLKSSGRAALEAQLKRETSTSQFS